MDKSKDFYQRAIEEHDAEMGTYYMLQAIYLKLGEIDEKHQENEQ